MPRMFHQANTTTSLSPGLPGALGAPLLGYRALGFSVVVDLRLSELLGGWRGTICVWPGACAQVWTNGPEQRDLRTERDAMWELKMGSGLGIATHLGRRSSSLSLAPGFGTRKQGTWTDSSGVFLQRACPVLAHASRTWQRGLHLSGCSASLRGCGMDVLCAMAPGVALAAGSLGGNGAAELLELSGGLRKRGWDF